MYCLSFSSDFWAKLGLNLVETWFNLGLNLVQTWFKLGLNLVGLVDRVKHGPMDRDCPWGGTYNKAELLLRTLEYMGANPT